MTIYPLNLKELLLRQVGVNGSKLKINQNTNLQNDLNLDYF